MAIRIDHTRRGPGATGEPPGPPRAGGIASDRRRGRGAKSNRTGRFERFERSEADDGWETFEVLGRFETTVTEEAPKRIITRNESPDISFDRSINPYRGCEHGCAYCYARPTHAYMGLSPGLDFETHLFAKPSAPALLERELAAPGYSPATIALGTNTDPYQPIERTRRITRGILEVLSRTDHPVGIVTKSALVARDIDILGPMAERGLAKVALSVTTLDARLARAMEPRAATPPRRIETLRQLSSAGIPTAVMLGPVVPGLNDEEIEAILARAADAGVRQAGYVMLRLPLEVRDLFVEWLNEHVPDRAGRVLSLIRQMRAGKDYDSTWGRRQRGTGPLAWSVGRRFELATGRLGLNRERTRLRTDLFKPPVPEGGQLRLL